MAEVVRSITVRIEVDTNKQTYAADFDGLELADVGAEINEWIESVLT